MSDSRARWVLSCSILGSSLGFIDGTAVGVALPSLQHELHATIAGVQWIVESHALFLSALMLAGGSIADIIGRRLVFMLGTGLFALASAWCAFAPDLGQLIAARALQGIGAALLTPSSLAIIGAYFADAERAAAIGTWSAFTAMTGAFGPVLGGFLVDHGSWRWIFLINLPLAVAFIVIAWMHIPESHERADARLDPIGATLATLGLGGVVYGLRIVCDSWGRWIVLDDVLPGCTRPRHRHGDHGLAADDDVLQAAGRARCRTDRACGAQPRPRASSKSARASRRRPAARNRHGRRGDAQVL